MLYKIYKNVGIDPFKADKFVKMIGSDNSYAATVPLPGGDTVALATDGVGTKLLIAKHFKKYDTIGIDLVAMCVNDLLCVGARPVSFLDYYATGKLDLGVSMDIIKGIKDGCSLARCDLVGGETAEMPDCYHNGEFDLAGFAMGIVEKKLSTNVRPGNLIIGIPSSGPHSNGYSLIRSLFAYDEIPLTPTRIYVNEIMDNLQNINACAHITGGGIHGNLTRVLNGLSYKFDYGVLESYLNDNWWGELFGRSYMSHVEFQSTFNCGWGMLIIAEEELDIPGSEILGKIL
jgi:phosphoribosylformylglycinamidine cyclo-ligase